MKLYSLVLVYRGQTWSRTIKISIKAFSKLKKLLTGITLKISSTGFSNKLKLEALQIKLLKCKDMYSYSV